MNGPQKQILFRDFHALTSSQAMLYQINSKSQEISSLSFDGNDEQLQMSHNTKGSQFSEM